MTPYEWNGALGASVLKVIWHFMDEVWRVNTVPVPTHHTGAESKTSDELRVIMDGVMKHSAIFGSESLRIHTVTSDSEAARACSVDLLTNVVGTVRVVVHTMDSCVNDVFTFGVYSQK